MAHRLRCRFRMSSSMVRSIALCLFIPGAVALFPVAATAADASSIAAARVDTLYPHVRTNERIVTGILRQAAAESPSFNSLVERLNNSNVIVYVRTNRSLPQSLEGQLTFMGSAGGRRYVVVSLAWGRPDLRTMATLGHELQHAVEIAERPDIVDLDSMAKAYSTFAESSTRNVNTWFETGAAVAAGERVWVEISRRPRNDAARKLEPAARP